MTFSRAVTLLATLCACDPVAVEDDPRVESGPGELANPPEAFADGDCCASDPAPGCSDVGVEECVCDADPYCCLTAWDSICVGEVDSLGCGTCFSDAPCCSPTATPGCEAPSVDSCVCAVDSYCCTTAWDSLCVGEVESLGCGTCAAASEWAQRVGGTGAEMVETGSAVAVDGAGNVYLLLSPWSGTVTVDGVAYVSAGVPDAMLVSYDAGGAVRWAKQLGSDDFDMGRGVAVDESGNVYVVGEAEGTIDLGGGALPSSGAPRDIWIASYDSSGAHRWSRRHGGSGTVLLTDVAVGDGALIVAGHMTGSLNVGGGLLTSAGSADMLLFSLDTDGSHRWSRRLGGTGDDHANGVAIDATGEVAVAGYFVGTADFGTGAMVSAGSADAVVLGLDAGGGTRFARRFGSTGIDIAEDVAIDDDGNTFAIAGFIGTIDLGSGPIATAGNRDVVVGSWTHAGALRWARRGGGTQLDYGRGLVLDADGDPVITGSFFGPLANFGGASLQGAGNYDTFLASYHAASGAHLWSQSFGGVNRDDGYDLAWSPLGALLLAGTTSGTFWIAGTSITTAGSDDAFVASLIE